MLPTAADAADTKDKATQDKGTDQADDRKDESGGVQRDYRIDDGT